MDKIRVSFDLDEVLFVSPKTHKTEPPLSFPFDRISLHIDDEAVICTAGSQYGFRTYQLEAQDDDWKEKIIERVKQIKKLEHGEH